VDVVISSGYRIVSYNHVMTLNLNIFNVVFSFALHPRTLVKLGIWAGGDFFEFLKLFLMKKDDVI
jgi:hypothetical protein